MNLSKINSMILWILLVFSFSSTIIASETDIESNLSYEQNINICPDAKICLLSSMPILYGAVLQAGGIFLACNALASNQLYECINTACLGAGIELSAGIIFAISGLACQYYAVKQCFQNE